MKKQTDCSLEELLAQMAQEEARVLRLLEPIQAEIVKLIRQVELVEGEQRGSVVIKLMRAISSAHEHCPGFPIIEARPDPDSKTRIVFYAVISGHVNALEMKTSDIIDIANGK